jgi:WD40-like Beta Propeller Repeat
MSPSSRLRSGLLATVLGAGLIAGPGPALAATTSTGTTGSPGDLAVLSPRTPTQVVVFDRQSHLTTVVSHLPSGQPAGASSSWPSVSADGSFVAFESNAPLQPDDTNGKADIYRWSRSTNAVQRVSVGVNGAPANGASHAPSISGDGNVVSFTSTATNLVSQSGVKASVSQVWASNLATGGMSLVSTGANGPGDAASRSAATSFDGRVVAFQSAATNLVAGDSNGAIDVFLRKLAAGTIIRASVDAGGGQASAASSRPSLSGDGGTVAFDSTGPLVANDTNKARDVFVRDLPPAVTVGPNPLDFGFVPIGTPSSLSVSVTSVGWTPVTMMASSIGGTDAGDFVVADDACAGQTIDTGASCSIAVLDVPGAPGSRTGTLSISDSALDSPQLVTLLSGVAPPGLHLDPAVGAPGIVTTVTGAGFPPGGLVTLHWSRGITQTMGPLVVGPDGTFSASVLVFHNDIEGPRDLIASLGAGGPTFADQTAPFLVVPATLQPSGAGPVSYLAPELQPLIIRH